jgi:hypothetical protein
MKGDVHFFFQPYVHGYDYIQIILQRLVIIGLVSNLPLPCIYAFTTLIIRILGFSNDSN